MEDKRMYIYEATEFNNIREIIKNAVKKHPENKAFILKEKKDKEINSSARPGWRKSQCWRYGCRCPWRWYVRKH